MTPIKDFFTKIFKEKKNDDIWLEYYSREEKKIKFTDKSIYNFMVDSVGNDKDFIALNYFGNRLSYNEFFYVLIVILIYLSAINIVYKFFHIFKINITVS